MRNREQVTGGYWVDEGGEYYSLVGSGFMGSVAYVALPLDHPNVQENYTEHDPDVNGGLTFSEDNVFGWDYAHFWDLEGRNNRSVPEDIANALSYFRSRAALPTEVKLFLNP